MAGKGELNKMRNGERRTNLSFDIGFVRCDERVVDNIWPEYRVGNILQWPVLCWPTGDKVGIAVIRNLGSIELRGEITMAVAPMQLA